MDRIGPGKAAGDQRVAGLVVRDPHLLVRAEEPLPLLGAGDQAFDPFLEFRLADVVLAPPRRQKRGLVDQVRQVGADEPGSHGGDLTEVEAVGQGDDPGVDLEDLLAADEVGTVDDHLAVEPTGTDQGGVERLGAVGGGQKDDAAVGVEAVHLDQELVEGLVALVVSARSPRASGLADGVEFVDEDQAGGLGLALANRLRTLDAPTPTNSSTKSEPESEKNGTPASPATARASSVLPVPGARPEAPPWESVRPATGTCRESAGSRRPREARRRPPRGRPRCRT